MAKKGTIILDDYACEKMEGEMIGFEIEKFGRIIRIRGCCLVYDFVCYKYIHTWCKHQHVN